MVRWLLLFVVIAVAAWQLATPPAAPTAALTTIDGRPVLGCAPPTRLAGADGVIQSDAPGGMSPFTVSGASAIPLAGFSVAARVLSREDYSRDREATYAPIDLALGWGPMRDPAVLSRLDISQSGRFYRYRWSGDAPIPAREIVRSSANMHMVPANTAIHTALQAIDAGDEVRIDGWLVRIEASDGWRWRSSLTREDSGAGACEVVYVCAVTRR